MSSALTVLSLGASRRSSPTLATKLQSVVSVISTSSLAGRSDVVNQMTYRFLNRLSTITLDHHKH